MRSHNSILPRLATSWGIIVLATLATVGRSVATAEVINSPMGKYQVGIDTLGNLYDPIAGVGFRRVVDGYDPIRPSKPREAYGVSANANSGFVDPNNVPGSVQNMNLDASNFQPTEAFKSTILRDAALNPLLQVDLKYVWVAENVLQISTQLSNLSPDVQHVLFSRNVNWDIAPSASFETITASALVLPVIDGSYSGFENPDPLVPFGSSTGAAGGFFGPGDLGAGLRLDLGSLQPVGTGGDVNRTHFSIFYAIGAVGQTEAQLRAQLGFSGGTNRINTAAMGFVFGNPTIPTVLISGAAFVPEPSSVAMFALGAVGMLWFAMGGRGKQLFGARA